MAETNNDNNQNTRCQGEETNKNYRIPSKRTLMLSTVLLFAVSVIAAGFSSLTSISSTLQFVFIVCAIVAFSAALCLKRSKLMFLAAPLAYILALILLRDPISALSSLVFFPASIMCANSFAKARSRVASICSISFVLALSEIVLFLISFIKSYGTVSFELLSEWINGVYTEISDGFIAITGESEELAALVSEDQIRSAIASFMLVSPAILICAYNIFAFIVQKLTLIVLKLHYNDNMLFESAQNFSMSKLSGIIYIISYIGAVISSSSVSVFSAVFDNLIIILMPGLFFVGIKTFFKRLKKRSALRTSLSTIAVIALFILAPALLFICLSLYGAWASVSSKYAD